MSFVTVKRLTALALSSLALVPTNVAFADSISGNLPVSITIVESCQVSTVPVAFGSQGSLGSAVNATGTINVTCTNTTPYTVALDAGGGTGATVDVRLMDDTVTYSLYSDSNHTAVWGDDVGVNTVAGTGTGSVQAYTVYGRVPAQATPAPGSYNDTVLLTVAY